MSSLGRFFASRWGPIITGIAVGVLAPILVKLGNPGNMGICVACFSRDIAGALGLHRAAPVQYIRPEIIGFVLGSLVAALIFREFRPRTGSAPLARFLLGMFAVIGALVFLGCPWRAYLRLGGGDWNAIFGIAGLLVGIVIGVMFLRMGYSLGRNRNAPAALGWPARIVVLHSIAVKHLDLAVIHSHRNGESHLPHGPSQHLMGGFVQIEKLGGLVQLLLSDRKGVEINRGLGLMAVGAHLDLWLHHCCRHCCFLL